MQETLDQPKQNNYDRIIDELFWMRKELEDMKQAIYDLTVLIAKQRQEIEKWVGVEEE